MAIQGPIGVGFRDVFPHGAYAMGVEPVRDFDRSTKDHAVQARDKETGVPVWAVEVLDGDPEARATDRSVKVKITSEVEPTLPDLMPGLPFRPVEFDGLRVRPYVNQQTGRLAYSFSADVMRSPAATVKGGTPAAAKSAA